LNILLCSFSADKIYLHYAYNVHVVGVFVYWRSIIKITNLTIKWFINNRTIYSFAWIYQHYTVRESGQTDQINYSAYQEHNGRVLYVYNFVVVTHLRGDRDTPRLVPLGRCNNNINLHANTYIHKAWMTSAARV